MPTFPARVILIPSLLLPLIASCGDGANKKLFADIQYATRCPDSNHCEGDEDRDICGINSDTPCMGFTAEAQLSCSITETEGGEGYIVQWSASQGGDFSISVSQMQVEKTGGFGGGRNCSVTVVEGANRYFGACGASTPNEAQPCQISGIEFVDDMGNPTIQGNIECRMMPNQASPNLMTDVTAIGAGPGPASMPGRWRLANCLGLEI